MSKPSKPAARPRAATLPRQVRVIGGQWRRHLLPVPDRPGLRPTPDRVRETLFNWLGQELGGWRVVDAFAGTGALGLEAASRGAADVLLIELDAGLLANLRALKQRLGAASVRVQGGDGVAALAALAPASVDLVLLDPPFEQAALPAPALAAADPHGASDRPARAARALSTEGLSRHFGALAAVSDVTIRFAPNLVHGIIGPNGAGKTTFTNLMSGAIPPSSGHVRIDGADVTGWPAHRIAHVGLGRSYQRTNIFGAFTVAENCALAAQARNGSMLRLSDKAYRDKEAATVAHALAVAGLADRAHVVASKMSNGEQRQLEIAMLIASDADLLLLDEPLAGMGPEETSRVVALLRDLAKDHTIVLIEHDMDAVFAAADTLTVLVQGKLLAHGAPDDIRRNEAVLEAYLGHHADKSGAHA